MDYYFDYNATTPIDPVILKTYSDHMLNYYGNPSSRNQLGLKSRNLWDSSIDIIHNSLKIEKNIDFKDNIIMTSGATESINIVIKSVLNFPGNKHVITTATEHKAVLESCKYIKSKGCDVTILPVNSNGHIDIAELENAITSDTVLIAVQWANNETGVIMPIKEIAQIAKKEGVLFLSDATQAIGKVEVNLSEIPIDYLACSGHKIHAPKGVGLLFLNPAKEKTPIDINNFVIGGGQQFSIKDGTLNAPLLNAFALAIKEAVLLESVEKIKNIRDLFESEMLSTGKVKINGDSENRVNNTSNIYFESIETENLMLMNPELCFSSGSACNENEVKSHVLKAMGLTNNQIVKSARFSFGKYNTEQEVLELVEKLKTSIKNNNANSLVL